MFDPHFAHVTLHQEQRRREAVHERRQRALVAAARDDQGNAKPTWHPVVLVQRLAAVFGLS